MNYTLNQLQIFLKIVQTNSVTKASEELNLTQPAVSIQLKNFQAQFDLPLTEIVGRKIFITDLGLEIAKYAERIIDEANAINYKALSFRGELAGRLKVSVVSTGKYIMPYFLSDFINQNPKVELLMDVTNKSKVVESLENNEVDMALVSILPPNLKVEKLDLLQNKLYLVGNISHKIDGKLKAKDVFKNLPLIFREKGSGTRQTMEHYIYRNEISVFKKMELTSNEAVKQAVLAGLGYSIMPLIGIRNELHNKDLKIIPVKGLPITTIWSLIWMSKKQNSPVAQAFLNYIAAEKANIIENKFKWYEQY